jgi:hypothetical protein
MKTNTKLLAHWTSLHAAKRRLEYRLATMKRLTYEIENDLRLVQSKMTELETKGGIDK